MCVLHEPSRFPCVLDLVSFHRCAYNRVNGTFACEDATSLHVLRSSLGFEGTHPHRVRVNLLSYSPCAFFARQALLYQIGALHTSTVAAALAGLDQQVATGSLGVEPLSCLYCRDHP